MKKNTVNDIKLNTDSVGFQIRESYKKARTNIIYSIVKKGCKKIAFTSSAKSEGKTITAVNIAIALAQQVDTRVLIVDCDLRRPRVQSVLDINIGNGITNYLNFECDISSIINKTKISNLDAICCGTIPPNPSELMTSDNMKELINTLSNKYDYIIFDTPPVGIVIDSIPVIKQADGVVMIVRDNVTDITEYKKTINILKRSEANILGIIFNGVESISKHKYGNGYRYDYYGKGKYQYVFKSLIMSGLGGKMLCQKARLVVLVVMILVRVRVCIMLVELVMPIVFLEDYKI